MQDTSNVIVVDNLPVVPEDKMQKLTDFVKKIYSSVSALSHLSFRRIAH
jgi:hypothetical protein